MNLRAREEKHIKLTDSPRTHSHGSANSLLVCRGNPCFFCVFSEHRFFRTPFVLDVGMPHQCRTRAAQLSLRTEAPCGLAAVGRHCWVHGQEHGGAFEPHSDWAVPGWFCKMKIDLMGPTHRSLPIQIHTHLCFSFLFVPAGGLWWWVQGLCLEA